MTRFGWTNLAVFFLIVAILSPYSSFLGTGGRWLGSVGVVVFSVAAVRCTIAAAHAPERKYTR